MKQKRFTAQKVITFYLIIFLVVITTSVGIAVYFSSTVKGRSENSRETYDNYYVLITPDRKTDFWKSVYEGAYEFGKSQNIMVEMLGDNLSDDYSTSQLIEIAIASKVDGIIVYADETEETAELIDKASLNGIPVVTVYGDNSSAERICFVGTGSYNLGREYGKQIINIAKENESLNTTVSTHMNDKLNVAVLMDTSSDSWNQDLIWSGIQNAVTGDNKTETQINISMVSVDNRNNFTSEESIRDIFKKDEIPNVIVCLNEMNTASVYKAVVDYNCVGSTNILGYFVSDSILKGISRKVIYSTMSVDTKQMGASCVKALKEYTEYGNTSQFYMVDNTIIDRNNVDEYMEDVWEEER